MNDSHPKILIHEYITGGGWKEAGLPDSLASEGFLMLSAFLDDFMRWGKITAFTTIDKRLLNTPISADSIAIVNPDKYKETFSGLLKECDLALIIAPETDNVLAYLVQQAEDCGVTTLGCTPAAIRTTGNKWECHNILSKAGLPLPETTIVETGFIRRRLTAMARQEPVSTTRSDPFEIARGINFPLVIKPVDGVGCAGVNLVKDMDMLRALFEDDQLYPNKVLLQEYIKGEHLSASIISNGRNFIILSLNRQHITEGMPFRYLGGEIMPPPEKDDALHNIVDKIVKTIPGLRGYFGVDLIKVNNGYKVIEINPRLTTSYTGLRKVININLAEAIYDSVINGILPENVKISGNHCFKKEMKV
jgi:tyramine---L-glutamate ligase